MGNAGKNFCQACNSVDGRSLGENNLTNINNPPITKIDNPIYYSNIKTISSVNDPNTNYENVVYINNNLNRQDSYNTSYNSHLPVEEEQKKTQIFSKNSNNIHRNKNTNLYNIINNYINNNYNNNGLVNYVEFSLSEDKDKTKETSARTIKTFFRKLLYAKKLSHHKLIKENSEIQLSEYIKGLNVELLNINLAPEENCVYLGTKFKGKKDGFGLEIFSNSNAIYSGIFRNGKRAYLGKFSISNQFSDYIFRGEIKGLYAKGFGIIFDKKKYKEYEGYLDKSMKNGYGFEKNVDYSEYKGCFLNGKREGIGKMQWDDNSFYEGEWKESKFNGYGIYQFDDGSKYKGEWKMGTMDGFGEFINPGEKRYFGFFRNDQRSGFGLTVWLNHKNAFIGFWNNNNMNGYGKLILKEKNKYGFWKEGKQVEELKEKEFYQRIRDQNFGFYNLFAINDYTTVLNFMNGKSDDE